MSRAIIQIHEKPPLTKALPLALQHVFAMFGATVLVPFLTGLSPAVALLTSGIGTLIFHFITKGKIPAYLGSSFAFIAPLAAFTMLNPQTNPHPSISQAMAGALVAGVVYIAVFMIIKLFGTGFIDRYIPSIVVGPVVMIIGLALAGVAVNSMASTNWIVAIFTLAVTILFSVFGKGLLQIIPILLGIISGYLFSILSQTVGWTQKFVDMGIANKDMAFVNFSGIMQAPWIANPTSAYASQFPGQVFSFASFNFPIPSFTLAAIITIAPIALVAIVEDLGHVFVIGNVTGKNLIKDPGFDRVLLGNGIATAVASLFGGPPSTTYGENIGVLSITKVYSAWVIRIAAVIAIVLSLVGKLSAFLSSIPTAVMGGVCILLFGMIAAAGMRTMIEAKSDLGSTRNLIIVALILILGVGIQNHGIAYATLAGIILNAILPEDKESASKSADKNFEADAELDFVVPPLKNKKSKTNRA